MEPICHDQEQEQQSCVTPKTQSLINNNQEQQTQFRKKPTKKKKTNKKKPQVLLEGYVVESNKSNSKDEDLKRTKSLTDEDLDELKGCLDLGFGFSYDEIPELCNTLPALELCYSMSQKYLDDRSPVSPSRDVSDPGSGSGSNSVANWKISSPGDHPEDVKARLKFWAQTVACTVKLCN